MKIICGSNTCLCKGWSWEWDHQLPNLNWITHKIRLISISFKESFHIEGPFLFLLEKKHAFQCQSGTKPNLCLSICRNLERNVFPWWMPLMSTFLGAGAYSMILLLLYPADPDMKAAYRPEVWVDRLEQLLLSGYPPYQHDRAVRIAYLCCHLDTALESM